MHAVLMKLFLAGRSGPTQKMIARALSVSQSTVARALDPKQRHRLLPQTVAAVQAEAERLAYRPQRIASILRSGRSHTIGVIYRSGVNHSAQERARLLAKCAIKAKYQLVTADLGWYGSDYEAIQNHLLGASVEGIILCNLVKNVDGHELVSAFLQRNIPITVMGGTIQDENWDYVSVDMRGAYTEMTRHHLQGGSRRLMLLIGVHDKGYYGMLEPPRQQRVEGFIEAVREAGGTITADEQTQNYLDLELGGKGRSDIVGEVRSPLKTEFYQNLFELGRVEVKALIREDRLPDSLICANDQIAAGAFSACMEHGVPVPDRIKISGADDEPFSQYCGVPLTTIRQPSDKLAEWSIAKILDLIENPRKRKKVHSEVFPCELLFRRSTGVSLSLDSVGLSPSWITPIELDANK